MKKDSKQNAMVLFYRKPKGSSYMFINRLFTIAGIQRGVPGLKHHHVLFDSMHLIELGVLAYLLHLALWSLVLSGFWGHYSENDPSNIELAIARDLESYYVFAQVGPGHRMHALY